MLNVVDKYDLSQKTRVHHEVKILIIHLVHLYEFSLVANKLSKCSRVLLLGLVYGLSPSRSLISTPFVWFIEQKYLGMKENITIAFTLKALSKHN